MDRRTFIKGSAAAAAGLASGLAKPATANAGPQVNTLVIVVDDLMVPRAPMITPNLDAFARQSTVFTEAHAAVAMCAPSRATMWTGRSPVDTGLVGHHNQYLGDGCAPCYRDVWDGTDLFSTARVNGWRTEGYGKITHSMMPGHAGMFEREVRQEPHPDNPQGWWGPWSDGKHPDRRVADMVRNRVRLLDERSIRPSLVACGFVRPHTPWVTPRWAWDAYDGVNLTPLITPFADGLADLADVPKSGDYSRRSRAKQARDEGSEYELVRAYCAATTFADAQLGRVLEVVPDSWAVVLTSDHGWMLGEKLTHTKATAWRSATRVPAMVRLPGRAPKVVDRPVSHIDLRSTIEGAMVGDTRGWFQPRPAIGTWWEQSRSVYWRKLHYIHHPDGSAELYNMGKDPLEANNLAGRGLSSEAKMRAMLPV